MTVELTMRVRPDAEGSAEWSEVSRIAVQLLDHLNSKDVQERIRQAKKPGKSSEGIQDAFLGYATSLGFASEAKGLFADASLALRPDHYKPLESSGILLEVARGRVTNNNLDLHHLCKVHLCPSADYLFLMVPGEVKNSATRNEYLSVKRRLNGFFEEGMTTNVRGLCLFGY